MGTNSTHWYFLQIQKSLCAIKEATLQNGGGGGNDGMWTKENFVGAGGETELTTAGSLPANTAQIWVYYNGIFMHEGVDITISGDTVTFLSTSLNQGDHVEIRYVTY